ncbi:MULTISPECIES: M48 family metalloprotease [unclassified Ruegeria]|uniref:M48 family metalloprotease n=1 Tax=unclassified Ruegeria TaxID=2625375 RepID=UPI001490D343|nr:MULTISPECIES: M48 family metalloprotease [unclassified Ruegeria]NOC44360.1 M48 family metalloprotease [Ruegeria sp. HKCCD7559]NOD83088.1 M48 family metalloprotease [Ruegeria sp. HKCCD6119]
MPISHVAAMAFERVSLLTSIPALILSVGVWLAAAAQSHGQSLIRDPDIERGLRELAFPVLRAAGLNTNRVQILVVNDNTFNAFVIDYNAIYLNYGLILTVESPEMLQAVIAHEAAHIANGHLARRAENLKAARRNAGLGTALALLAAAAGGGEAAIGIAAGTQGAAIRSFLGHTRAEEASADRSAASYLRWAQISPSGMVDLHRKFAGQELLSVANQDPYMRSHPTSRERLRAAEAFLDEFGDKAVPNANADYWFARVKGKLSAFLRSPSWTLRRAKEETAQDIRLMREASAYHQNRDLDRARRAIDKALTLRPNDPYYYDLKGQILLENRQIGAAVEAYGNAVEMAPNDALILAGYGRALLAQGQTKQALSVLEKARARDYRNARLLQDLGVAYAQVGNDGMASTVTAERYALQGRLKDAGIHAKRAVARLPEGSPGWQRAQDVLIASERLDKDKRKRK